MALQSHYALQKAVYQTLSGDATLGAMISGVFDMVPQDTDYPYVVFGEGYVERVNSLGYTLHEHTLKLRVYTRQRGRKELYMIMERMEELLDEATPSLDDHTLILLHYMNAEVQLGKDGLSMEGGMRFRAMTEPE